MTKRNFDFAPSKSKNGFSILFISIIIGDVVAEWLRRWTRNLFSTDSVRLNPAKNGSYFIGANILLFQFESSVTKL